MKMSKIFGSALVSAFLVASGWAAVTTNQLGQVVTTDANGVVTSIVVPASGTNSPRVLVGLEGYQVSTNIDATTSLSNYTPRDIGDLLLFPRATNNLTLYIAYGTANTNWARITTTK